MAEQQLQQQTLELYEEELRQKAQAGDAMAAFVLVEHFEAKAAADNMLEAQHRINYLMKASNQGVGAASLLLATWYLTGHYVEKDLAKAILFYEHAATLGKEPAGYYRLAQLFDEGIHFPVDTQKAEKYLQKAVTAGYPDAIFTFATKKIATDLQQAYTLLYNNYTENGHIRSLFFLHDEPRFERAKVENLLKQFSHKESYAAALYASCLMRNNELEAAQSVVEFSKKIENPLAYYVSALILQQMGEFDLSQKDMLIAADLGHIEASYRSAVALSQQVDTLPITEERNELASRALLLFAKAAHEGYAPAQFSLGQCWLQGWGLEQSEQEAQKWFDRAAKQGHIDATFALALTLPNDHPQHFPLLEIAANAGHSKAMLCLGMYFQYNQQLDQVMPWFEKAKEEQDPRADYLIGQAYLKGLGAPLDPKQAVEYFKLAADSEDVDAYFALYEAYRDGIGVRRNKKLQAKYLKLAQDFQHPEALEIKE